MGGEVVMYLILPRQRDFIKIGFTQTPVKVIMEQVTYHQAMDSMEMSPAQYGNGSLSMGMVH